MGACQYAHIGSRKSSISYSSSVFGLIFRYEWERIRQSWLFNFLELRLHFVSFDLQEPVRQALSHSKVESVSSFDKWIVQLYKAGNEQMEVEHPIGNVLIVHMSRSIG